MILVGMNPKETFEHNLEDTTCARCHSHSPHAAIFCASTEAMAYRVGNLPSIDGNHGTPRSHLLDIVSGHKNHQNRTRMSPSIIQHHFKSIWSDFEKDSPAGAPAAIYSFAAHQKHVFFLKKNWLFGAILKFFRMRCKKKFAFGAPIYSFVAHQKTYILARKVCCVSYFMYKMYICKKYIIK